MKKWYLSEDGNVSGPFSIDDVQTRVSKNNNLYGWNPTYSHWLPVIKIPEFKAFLSEVKSQDQVSKELVDKFINKKIDLNKKTALIDSSIVSTIESISRFEKEIVDYKELTENLAPGVKDNIEPLEKKYNSLNNQLIELEKAAEISRNEFSQVEGEFSELLLSKTALNYDDLSKLGLSKASSPSKNKVTSSPINEVITSSRSEAVPSQKVVPSQKREDTTSPKNNESLSPKSDISSLSKSHVNSASKNNISKVEHSIPSVQVATNIADDVFEDVVINPPKQKPVVKIPKKVPATKHPFDQRFENKEIKEVKVVNTIKSQPIEPEKKGFTSKLKSVFGQNHSDDDVSDELLKLEKEAIEEADDEVVFNDSEMQPAGHRSSESNNKRQRRRRF